MDSKLPVWYPYYMTWCIGVPAELALVTIHNTIRALHTSPDYVCIAIQMIRLTFLIALLTVYFCLRKGGKGGDNNDEENQPLLNKKTAANVPGSVERYGGVSNADSTTKTSDIVSQDSYLAREQKAKDLITKRLQHDGNWFTYTKGFTVSH
jgi:hypothetical protein